MDDVVLELRGLGKDYGPRRAVDAIDLDIRRGEIFGLLGPNGAGKSTLIGIVSSLVNPSAGAVRIFGHDLARERGTALSLMGLVPQELNFNQFEKPFDIVVNQAGFYGIPRAVARERAEKYLKELQIWDKAQVPSRTLSGGMKRRLMIARAMVHEPRLLILDEPTAGVDIEIRRSMWKFISAINRAGTTVILTTHYLEEAEQLCRNVAIIDKGTIIENTTTKRLIAQLDVETFVLDLAAPMVAAPSVDGVRITRVDDQQIEVEMSRGHDLNSVFATLTQSGIVVTSMRNKANRLEELFVRLVDGAQAPKAGAA